jgi:flagellar motor protein MotB
MSEEVKKEEEKPKEEVKTEEQPKENNIEIKEEKIEEIKKEEPPKAEENLPKEETTEKKEEGESNKEKEIIQEEKKEEIKQEVNIIKNENNEEKKDNENKENTEEKKEEIKIEQEIKVENKEENKEKILGLISNSINKSIYDFDSLLFLFKFHNFIEGIELISKQRNSFKELFFIYLNNKDHQKLLYIFIDNNPKEKSLWLIALHFFLNELKNDIKDEEKKFFFKNALSLFLIKLLENDIFPSLYILEIIKESNFEIPLFLLENFFLKAVEKENNNFVNKLVKSNDYDVTSQEINDEMTTLITMPISIIIDKCHECKNKINIPCVVFRCKHIYHVSCLNKKDKNGNKEIIPSCPKCGPNKITV